MSLRNVALYHVSVPFKTRVKHASHDRTDSENLVVRVTLDDRTEGYGEGVPRSYVTGETVESAFATLASFDFGRHFGRIDSFEAVVRRIEALVLAETESDPRGMAGNAARCALEIAVLDAYGRRFQRPMGDAVRLADVDGLSRSARAARVRYSGAITASSRRSERIAAWKTWLYGFGHVKLKVGVDGQDDPSRLREVRKILGNRIDIRIDANEAWSASEVEERVRALLPFHPSVLEQPVRHEAVDSLADLRPRIGMPVMLDESLCGYPDAARSIL